MKATIAERGQITIPKKLRQKLGLKKGSILNFEVKKGALIGIKECAEDPLRKAYGILGHFNTEDIINELRGETK